MNEVTIDVVEAQSTTAPVECRFDPLWTMIGVPQFRGDEHVLAQNLARPEHVLHGIANRFFIAIAFRAIEMSEPDFQCSLGRLSGRDGIGNECAKPDSRDCTRSV